MSDTLRISFAHDAWLVGWCFTHVLLLLLPCCVVFLPAPLSDNTESKEIRVVRRPSRHPTVCSSSSSSSSSGLVAGWRWGVYCVQGVGACGGQTRPRRSGLSPRACLCCHGTGTDGKHTLPPPPHHCASRCVWCCLVLSDTLQISFAHDAWFVWWCFTHARPPPPPSLLRFSACPTLNQHRA